MLYDECVVLRYIGVFEDITKCMKNIQMCKINTPVQNKAVMWENNTVLCVKSTLLCKIRQVCGKIIPCCG